VNGHGYVGMMPGQRANVPEGGATELPIFRAWMHNLYLYELLTVASVLWEIWTLGPHLSVGILFVWMFAQLRQYPRLCIILTVLPIWYYGIFVEYVWIAWPAIPILNWSSDQCRPWWLWIVLLIPAPVWWRAWYQGRFRNTTGDNGLMDDEPEQMPAPRAPLVIVTEYRDDNGNMRGSDRREISEQLEKKMPEIARYAIGLQTPFSGPEMAGKGKPLSKSSFPVIRDELLALGALEVRDPDMNTVRWTIKGLDWCRTFNGSRPTPP